MKYLSKTFSVPVAGPSVTDEEWDAIWAPKCQLCERPLTKVDRDFGEGGVCVLCEHHHQERGNLPTYD